MDSYNYKTQGAVSITKTVLPGMAISMLKIRRPLGRLIFNMGIAVDKTVFILRRGPGGPCLSPVDSFTKRDFQNQPSAWMND